jgi:uncharacterized membrane protein
VVRTLSWDGYVRLAFDELRLAGAAQPQVAPRLCAALEDLKTVAPPERQPVLDHQLELLEAFVRRQFDDEEDVSAFLVGDQQGIESGQDVADGRPDDYFSGEEQGQRNQRTGLITERSGGQDSSYSVGRKH